MTLRRTPAALAALRDRPRRLLVVLAHPDDESYGCAGALARAGHDGDAAAVLLCMTRGEASSLGRDRGLAPAEVGALREGRLLDVARLCGLAGLLIPGLPDAGLARLDLADLVAPVRVAIEAFRPHVVLTGDARGVNGHADHIATHWAVRHALAGVVGMRLAMTAYPPAACEAARPRLLFPTPDAEIDVTLRLSDAEIARKEACLRVHEALVTLDPEAAGDLVLRPPVEHFDLLGEVHAPRLADLFEALPPETPPA